MTSDQYNNQYRYRQAVPPTDDSVYGRVIRPNFIVFGIIAACTIVFVLELMDWNTMLSLFAMRPDYLMPWMFVTSIFMHGDFSHLFFNMFMLFMFGMTLERMIGHKLFLSLFLTAGIVGNLGYVIYCLATGSVIPAIGASGAIYGIFACLVILAPDIKVYLFFFLPMKIVHAFLLYAAIDILFLSTNDSVAHAAHLAGAAVGLAFGWYIKKKIAEAQAYKVSYSFNSR
ncbi:MAG: rhomboid family intramembrane serine protease [Candidatus Thermoplasmatota archaeon]|nr:rhomboid family intramembrane serine protease [Candidatus Thermoplasmatota archaeon]MBU4070982.1 rhomboid family intramembrane serine protease [Candidatus Thermoplasmatota archaeon]MBU4145220.1 rhomboid family intramembrane serine protease [Candidatus Thermoplasmatota archaeon]MBU4591040.1 rhomboid family intramembrane serine protease [Candidatus Thermoplasmatota archaeon]